MALRISARNSKIKKLWWCPLERVDKYKKLYVRNNIFKKRIPDMRFLIIYILVQFFSETALGRFSQCLFYNFSSSANHGGRNFYSVPPPTIKKLPTALQVHLMTYFSQIGQGTFIKKKTLSKSKWSSKTYSFGYCSYLLRIPPKSIEHRKYLM